MHFCVLPVLSPFLSPGSSQAPTERACPQQRLIHSRRDHGPYSRLYLPLSKKTKGKTKPLKTAHSLAIPFAGETRSGLSWVLVSRKEYFALTSQLLEKQCWGVSGVPMLCLFIYGHPSPMWRECRTWKEQSSRHTGKVPAFLQNGPHSWLREMLPWSEASLPRAEKLL